MSDSKYIILNEIESTNNYANQLILSNAAEEGTVVLAHYQIKGKGQGKNNWESEYGKNLLMSLVMFPKFLPAENQFMISKVVSIALIEFLKNETELVSIKWPNDIYVDDRKIAGILIENSVKGQNLSSSVLGIGLNLNQQFFMSDAPNPVSLGQITGKNYKIERVAKIVVECIQKWYVKLKENQLSEINNNYFSLLYRCKGWWNFRERDKVFEARIAGIGEFGQLMLELHTGERKEFTFKEIEFV